MEPMDSSHHFPMQDKTELVEPDRKKITQKNVCKEDCIESKSCWRSVEKCRPRRTQPRPKRPKRPMVDEQCVRVPLHLSMHAFLHM